MKTLTLAAAFATALIVALPASANPADSRSQAIAAAENVTHASLHVYGLTDDQGVSMDTLKVIDNPRGGYLGVYHRITGNLLVVRLAASSDLAHWRYVGQLDTNASQPTITVMPDGGYVVADERNTDGTAPPQSWIGFLHYANLDSLLAGQPDKVFNAPHTLAPNSWVGTEGTPNIYSATATTLTVGFHYNQDPGTMRDQEGRGVLTNFSQWVTEPDNALGGSLNVSGNKGGRETYPFGGTTYTLVEGQGQPNDWGSWRCFLELDGQATQLALHTDGGSTACANPRMSVVDNGRTLVFSYFVMSEGAAPGEAGQLLSVVRLPAASVAPAKPAPAESAKPAPAKPTKKTHKPAARVAVRRRS